jgi:hypothetical protein
MDLSEHAAEITGSSGLGAYPEPPQASDYDMTKDYERTSFADDMSAWRSQFAEPSVPT